MLRVWRGIGGHALGNRAFVFHWTSTTKLKLDTVGVLEKSSRSRGFLDPKGKTRQTMVSPRCEKDLGRNLQSLSVKLRWSGLFKPYRLWFEA